MTTNVHKNVLNRCKTWKPKIWKQDVVCTIFGVQLNGKSFYKD